MARLATVDEQARPHVVPICFALVGEVLYSVIDEKPKRGDPTRLRRLRNISANPRVQVLFDVYDDGDWSRLCYVQIRGRARILSSGKDYGDALRALRQRYRQYSGMGLEGRPVIAVDMDAIVGWPI